MATKVDALVFDAYGTLYDVHSVIQACEQLFPGRGTQLSQLWRTKQLEYTWQRSLMGRFEPFSRVTVEALEYGCEALGLRLEAAARERLMAAYRELAPFADAESALPRLTGIPLAILSNGSPDMLDPLVRASRLSPYIRDILSVNERSIFKPHPSVYRIALDALGMAAERIGFVSSNCWDACGAAAFGFQAWWINRAGAPLDRLGVRPAAVVTSLDELPSLVG
jgi:2-haloacid dehalogenase